MTDDDEAEPALIFAVAEGQPARPASTDARDMWVYSVAQCISATGSWAQKACIGWLAWSLTHSPAWVGGLAMTDLVAALWVAPLAGTLTDRTNPLRLLNATNWMMMASAGLLGLAAASGHLDIHLLWALALLDSTVQGFGQPVRSSVVPLIVPPNRFAQAISLNSIAFNVARSIGPAFAGLALSRWSPAIVFGFNLTSYLALTVALVLLASRLDRPGHASDKSFRKDVAEGFRHIAHVPALRVVFLLALAVSLLARPFTELLPAFSGALFNGGPETLTMFMTAQGLGALVGAGWMLCRPSTGHLVATTFASAFALALSLVLFSFTHALWPAIGVIAVAGLFHVVNNIGMQSLLQLRTADRMRGRVLGLYSLLFRIGPSLGAFLIGLAAERIPLPVAVGTTAAAAAGLILLLSRDRNHAASETSPARV